MAKRRISMFEAFGATSPKGAKGPQEPQRSETQRAIDAQRGLDPREPRAPSAEVLRALHTQFEAELAAARRAPSADLEASSRGAVAEQLSGSARDSSPGGAAEGHTALGELRAADAAPARAPLPPSPARRTSAGLDEPSAPEGGFVLPFGWVTFLCLQLGLFAVAFGLGALTMGGRPVAASGEDPGDLRLGQAESAAPGNSPGNRPASPREANTPPRSAPDPQGVRGGQPAPKAADPRAPVAGGAEDPDLAAFLDPQNHFTLQVASYDGSPNGQGMARHWQAYLRERKLPAVLRQVGTRLALFVGASANSLEIEDLQKRVIELRDERGTRIFAAPRVVNLKDYR